MSFPGGALVLLGVAAAVVLLVLLEAWRQRRVYGRPSGRPNLAGVGMLELQKHLQADRRVDALVELQKDESAETERDAEGEKGGAPARRP